ncbi:hypothetical protein [Streptomyces spinosus]|uniref:hypothetical protein n=1 Tax=Streptomyces spinosus TaxID=2872623 RepID=UPI001CEDFE51|nr:hypothetical protein [Streptomyces spinosus]
MVWGPAGFTGAPPRWLVAEGLLVGVLGVVAMVGVAFFGAWVGKPSLAGGEASMVCAAALAVYLMCVRAGRALVGITALLAMAFAARTPQAAAGMVLESRGLVESAVVTSVEKGNAADSERGRYLCSVSDARGVTLGTQIWRGCGPTSRPGDVLPVVYDPRGSVPPRGVGQGPLDDLVPWAAAVVGASVVAVVRSIRPPAGPTEVPLPTGTGLRRPG